MTYADIFATEARGMFSPPNGEAPQIIPDRWRNSPEEEFRTDLPELTNEELNELGWKGPISMPPESNPGTSYFTHSYEWNKETREYDATELETYEKEQGVDYDKFWTDLLDTDVYVTMRTAASTTLAANTLLTEFIALLDDAKRRCANTTKIQASISGILAGITFSTDELAELQTLFDSTGMTAVYTLS